MSNPSEKKHPWAKFRATPSAPRPPKEHGGSGALPLGTRPPFAPLTAAAGPKVEQPVEKVRSGASPRPAHGEKKPAGKTHKHTEAKAPKPQPQASHAPKVAAQSEAAKEAKPAAEKPVMEAPLTAAVVPAPTPVEFESVLSDLEKAGIDPSVVRRVRRGGAREKGLRRVAWLWSSLKDSVRNHRQRRQQLGAWWRVWRTGSAARVLLAFCVIYGLLALMRKPSEVAVERSRMGEEMAFLNGFLTSYCKAGGQVLGVKPHGGSELYPRGVLLQGDVLDAFRRATPGGVFSVHVADAAWNPLEGFYGFMPVYAGGHYFNLDRKFNFALYRTSFLIRKDSEEAGTVLLALVERAR